MQWVIAPLSRSFKVVLVSLNGLLDPQKHGGEPLVQARDGVELLHLNEHSARFLQR